MSAGRLRRLSGKEVEVLFGLEERILDTKRDLEERAALLASRDLAVPGGEDLVLGFFRDDRLVATGALVGNILQGIAVTREMEGEGAAAAVTSALLKKAVERGMRKVFLYSKPQEARLFRELGFSLLAEAVAERSGLAASLLEWGTEGIESWKARIGEDRRRQACGAGAVVVTATPSPWGTGGFSSTPRGRARGCTSSWSRKTGPSFPSTSGCTLSGKEPRTWRT